MKLRKLFALLMTAVMLLSMMPMAHAELTGCNHDWDGGKWINGVPANCQDWKPKTYTCTICGETWTGEECGPCQPGSKTWVIPQASNCQEYGVWEITCKYCGEWLDGNEEPGPHKWVTNTIEEPACEYPGWKETVCAVCGSEQDSPQEIPPLGHNWGPEKLDVAATCIMPGLKSRMCTRCNTREEWETDYGSHSWGEWRLITQGDCVNPGTEVRTCSLCGQEQSRPAAGGAHAFGEWQETKAPTCTELGKREHVCTRCGYTEWGTIAKVDHSFGAWYVVTPAQIGVAGLEQRDCTYGCGTNEQREIPPLEEDANVPGNVNPDGLTVTKSAPLGSHSSYYYPGEQVPFTITVTNNTGVALFDVEITDPIKGGNEDATVDRIPSMQPGESTTATFTYTTTEADAAIGTECFWNTAYATGYTADGIQVNGTSNTVKVLCVMPHGISISKAVSSTPANGEFYVPGETICFIISMSNDTTYPLYNVTLTDPLCEDQYFHDEVNGMSYLYMDNLYISEDNPLGFNQSARVAPTYVVTEADAEAGFVTNTAIVHYQTWYGENKSDSASVTVKCGKASDTVVLEKIDMRSPANGEYYVPGEVIKYGLTVRSTEENPLQNIIIYDPLKGGDQVVFGPADSWVLGAGFDYTVTEADAQRGYIENTGYATFTYQNTGEDGTVYSNTLTLPCGFVKDAGLSGALSVTKSVTSTPANGSYYVPGETVTYEVYVKNNGEPLDNLHVSDWMWEQDRVFGTIATGEDVTYPVTHIVTDAHARAKHVNNIACATAIDKEGNQIAEYSNLVKVPCGFPEGEDPFGVLTGLDISKEVESLPLNGSYYTEGETVAYKIIYTNSGELPLTDVQIYDAMGGMGEIATAETLNPGESRACWLNYTVTAVDVSRGYISNTAVGQFELNGWVNTASSNTVTVDTNGKQDLWTVHPFWPGEDPEYDPGTGWFPDSDPALEGDTPSFGTIDTDALHSGETYCVRTITGRDNVSVSYETGFCAVHGPVQASALLMQQAAATPEMQVQAAAYATALWRSEVEKLYQELMAAADPAAQAVLMTEYIRFVADIANYEAMLKVLHPDQPALAASKVAEIWENKCIDLCYDTHAAADERKDSLLAVTPTAGAAAVSCTCEATAQEAGRKAIVQRYCAMHGFPFSMTDALLRGNDTADAWTMVRQIWGVELTNAYNKLYAAMGENKLLAMAEQHALTQWMMAREASLIALYPDNPEVVVQLMAKLIMERVNELCQMTN